MNVESTFEILRREQLLIDHAPHSVQFQDLTGSLLRVFSAAAVIPPLTVSEIRMYAALALLHDVGKRAIPSEILDKPGPLTKEEFEVMKTHTTQGCFPRFATYAATTMSGGTAAVIRTGWRETTLPHGCRRWDWQTLLTP